MNRIEPSVVILNELIIQQQTMTLRRHKTERKFPMKEWEKAKKKERKILDQGSEENRRNM